MELTAYERQARHDIDVWKARPARKALTVKLTVKAFDRVTVPAPLVEALGLAAQKTLHGLNATAQATLRSEGSRASCAGFARTPRSMVGGWS